MPEERIPVGAQFLGVQKRVAPHLLQPTHSPDCQNCRPYSGLIGRLGPRKGRTKLSSTAYAARLRGFWPGSGGGGDSGDDYSLVALDDGSSVTIIPESAIWAGGGAWGGPALARNNGFLKSVSVTATGSPAEDATNVDPVNGLCAVNGATTAWATPPSGVFASEVTSGSGATASATDSISGSGASGTVTGTWAATSLGTYDATKKYILSSFSASVHAYSGIPAAEVTASIDSIEIELADSGYSVLKTISISCAVTSHDVPAGGGVYGDTDGTISLSIPDLAVLDSWTGSIAYIRLKINWSYDHPFGTGTVASGATITAISAGGTVSVRSVSLPTTSVSATGGTVTQTFAASVPEGSGVLRYRHVSLAYSYKGYWAPVSPSSGSSTGCGSVTVSSDNQSGSTSVSLSAAAGYAACTQLSSTVKNIRDTGSLEVSGALEEYYSVGAGDCYTYLQFDNGPWQQVCASSLTSPATIDNSITPVDCTGKTLLTGIKCVAEQVGGDATLSGTVYAIGVKA